MTNKVTDDEDINKVDESTGGKKRKASTVASEQMTASMKRTCSEETDSLIRYRYFFYKLWLHFVFSSQVSKCSEASVIEEERRQQNYEKLVETVVQISQNNTTIMI